MNYIDCHNHLLPSVDDGSQSKEESLNSLRLLRTQGVTTAILTPHVNSPYVECTLKREYIFEAYEELKAACGKEPEAYPALLLGCEYYIDPVWESSIDPITMAGTEVVMLELPYDIKLSGVQRVVRIAQDRGYCVLLAHPEKYHAFKYQWDEALPFLRDNPNVLVQLESWDIGKHNPVSWRFIESRTATVIGTDSHGYHRPPSFDRAVNALTEWARDDTDRREYANALTEKNAAKLLGRTIRPCGFPADNH